MKNKFNLISSLLILYIFIFMFSYIHQLFYSYMSLGFSHPIITLEYLKFLLTISTIIFIPAAYFLLYILKIFCRENIERSIWISFKKLFIFTSPIIPLIILTIFWTVKGCSGEECMGPVILLFFEIFLLISFYFIGTFIIFFLAICLKYKEQLIKVSKKLSPHKLFFKGVIILCLVFIIIFWTNYFGIIKYFTYGCFPDDNYCVWDKARFDHNDRICNAFYIESDINYKHCINSIENLTINDINSNTKLQIQSCLKQKYNLSNTNLFYVGQNEVEIEKVKKNGYNIIHSVCNRPIKYYSYDYDGNICYGPVTDCYKMKDFPVDLILCSKTGDLIIGIQSSTTIEQFAKNCEQISW